MKKLIFGILFLFLFTQCAYRISAYDTCKTYDGTRTAADWKRLQSNKKKSPHLYKPFRYPSNKKQKSNEQ